MVRQEQSGNNKGSFVLPLLAAVGTGAATYYSLRNTSNTGQQSAQQSGQTLPQFTDASASRTQATPQNHQNQ